jgi:response regulator of citrate/malate metabolism
MPANRQTYRPRTAREMAEKVGCSPRTIRKYWAIPRAEYEANALTKSMPWAAVGMSRATWYRHGKPTQQPTKEAQA